MYIICRGAKTLKMINLTFSPPSFFSAASFKKILNCMEILSSEILKITQKPLKEKEFVINKIKG